MNVWWGAGAEERKKMSIQYFNEVVLFIVWRCGNDYLNSWKNQVRVVIWKGAFIRYVSEQVWAGGPESCDQLKFDYSHDSIKILCKRLYIYRLYSV